MSIKPQRDWMVTLVVVILVLFAFVAGSLPIALFVLWQLLQRVN